MAVIADIVRAIERVAPEWVAAPDRARLQTAWERGATTWSDVSGCPETFVRLATDHICADDVMTFSTIDGPEVYLAAAVAVGERSALDAFDSTYLPGLVGSISRFRLGHAESEEIKQAVREIFLVSETDSLPGICRYAGQGRLRGAIYVTAYRLALRALRSQGRYVADDDRLLVLPAVATDPDLAAVRRECSQAFLGSFREAVANLDVRLRNMLRLRYADGVSVDGIATIYGIHRTTASRNLSVARRAIAEATRSLLRERLELSPSQVSSLIRAVDSDLDFGLETLFLAETGNTNTSA